MQHYSEEEKRKYEPLFAHLNAIDYVIVHFISLHGIKVASVNNQRCPERSLEWINPDGIKCVIQIFLNADQETFTLWLCASKDKGNKRFWKQIKKAEELKPPFDPYQIQQLFEESFIWLDSVNDSELEFVSNIKPISTL